MKVLSYGIILFFIAFTIHFFIWKVHLPKNQTVALLQTFFGTLVTGIILLWKFKSHISPLGIYPPATAPEYIQLIFMYTSLTFAYVTTYSAVEVDSPSLVIIMNIAKSEPGGIDKDALEQKMNNDVLVTPRIKDLFRSGMVYLDRDRYKLTSKGIVVARIFVAYRKLLKKTEKGG